MKQTRFIPALFFLLLLGNANAQNNQPVEAGAAPTVYTLMNEAKKNIESSPELALKQMNDLLNQSNFKNKDNFTYRLSPHKYVDVAEIKVKCLNKLNKKSEILPIYYDIIEKINSELSGLTLFTRELYQSKVVLLKVELKDTTDLFDFYEKLYYVRLPEENSSRESSEYSAAIQDKFKDAPIKELSVNEMRRLALDAAAPYCHEKLNQKEFNRKKALNPHWGKQIPSASLLGLNKSQVGKEIGNPVGTTAEKRGRDSYQAVIYKTAKAKYHIIFLSGVAKYITLFPLVQQNLSTDELIQYGWKFNILNESTKNGFGISENTTGSFGQNKYIDFVIDVETDNYNSQSYHVVFNSSNGKTVNRIDCYYGSF